MVKGELKMRQMFSILIISVLIIANFNAQTKKDKVVNQKQTKPKVTFIELGSVLY